MEGAQGDAERQEAEDVTPRPWYAPRFGERAENREGRSVGVLSKKAYKIVSVVLAAVMLGALVSLATAEGPLGEVPRYLLIGIAGVSGAAAVFAARKGWR